jgi:hypothetical protein
MRKERKMNEVYACIATGLRDAGLPASTFIVEQYLARNDFQGLIALLLKAQEECNIVKNTTEPCQVEG